MTTTSTNANSDTLGLTLDAILKTWAKLEALLPEMRYVTSAHAPLWLENGEPAMFRLPESVFSGNPFELPSLTGPFVAVFHPDNLAYFKAKARGNFRLVEWKPQEPTL